MLTAIGSLLPGSGSGSDPLALWRGVDDAVRKSRAQRRPEPPIMPPAVILPRTASWITRGQPGAEAQPAPAPTSLLQTA